MYNIIPIPSVYYQKDDTFPLSSDLIIYTVPEFEQIAKSLLEYIRPCFKAYTGHIDTTSTINSSIRISYNDTLAAEEYSLNIDNLGITIEIASVQAGLHALNTFKQILPAYSTKSKEIIDLDCCYISDKPRYCWRGFMLDCARHFIKIEDILSILDELSYLKINKFHWHLSDDQGYRVESRKFPNLNIVGSHRNDTQIGGLNSKNYKGTEYSGFYTREDIAKVVKYAERLHIEVIPEISIVNHCTAIIASYPTLNHNSEKISVSTNFNINSHSIDYSRPDNVELIKGIITEVAELFPSKHFHIGGKHLNFAYGTNIDTNYNIEKSSCIDYVNDISLHILSLGKKPIAYDCLLDKNLLDNVIIQVISTANNPHIVGEIKKGRLLIMSKEEYSNFKLPYARLSLSKVYHYQPNIDDIENTVPAFNTNILGVEAYLNTSWIYDISMLQFCIFPRLSALAERAWSDEEYSDYDNFLRRLLIYDEYLRSNRIVYAKRQIFNKISTFKSIRNCHIWRTKDPYCEFRLNQKITE